MTDNEKMTDNEIIKELNLRIDDFSRETLDLIKRQKAEIERLNVELKAMRGSANSYKLENERLQKNIDGLNIFTTNHMKVIRLRAIKEFAERICNGRVSNDPVVIAVRAELVVIAARTELECMKEMTEELKNDDTKNNISTFDGDRSIR